MFRLTRAAALLNCKMFGAFQDLESLSSYANDIFNQDETQTFEAKLHIKEIREEGVD